MTYYSTKTYNTDRGLSCCFRQWRANSHCNKLHGYSIGVKITFICERLDTKNWVYDFGNTAWIKAILENQFDHTTLVAKDDPDLNDFLNLSQKGIIDLRIVDHVGCEKFAEWIYQKIYRLVDAETSGRVQVKSVEVFEHGANSAIVEMD